MDEAKEHEIHQWLIKCEHDLGAVRLIIRDGASFLDVKKQFPKDLLSTFLV